VKDEGTFQNHYQALLARTLLLPEGIHNHPVNELKGQDMYATPPVLLDMMLPFISYILLISNLVLSLPI
jgi:hypothetical protein